PVRIRSGAPRRVVETGRVLHRLTSSRRGPTQQQTTPARVATSPFLPAGTRTRLPARRAAGDCADERAVVGWGRATWCIGPGAVRSRTWPTNAKSLDVAVEAQFSHRVSLRGQRGDPSGNRTRVTSVRGRCP